MSKFTFGAALSTNSTSTKNDHIKSSKHEIYGSKNNLNNDTIPEYPAPMSVYTVSLVKREIGGFGFLIRQKNEMPYFSIWEIIKNGSAENNGKIRKGDIILKVANEDLSQVGYERGLEILKSIRPGSSVELTLQSVGNNTNDSIDLIDFTHQHYQNNSSNANKIDKGVMSPLQRFKKKFISCAGTPMSNNIQSSQAFNSGNNSQNQTQNKIAYEETRYTSTIDNNNNNNNNNADIEPLSKVRENENSISNSPFNLRRSDIIYNNQPLNENNKTKIDGHKYRSIERDRLNYFNSPLPKSPLIERKTDFNKTALESTLLKSNIASKKPVQEELEINNRKTTAEEKVNKSPSNEFVKNNELNDKNANKSQVDSIESSLISNGFENFEKYLNTMVNNKNNNGIVMNKMNRDEYSPKALRSRTFSTINKYSIYREPSKTDEIKIEENEENSTTKNLANSKHRLSDRPLTNQFSKSRSMSNTKQVQVCQSPKCKNLKSSKLGNTNSNKNSSIQIIQDGDDIRINIDGNIEILTNRLNDRKIISLSPQCIRKMSSKSQNKNDNESSSILNLDSIKSNDDEKINESHKKDSEIEDEDFSNDQIQTNTDLKQNELKDESLINCDLAKTKNEEEPIKIDDKPKVKEPDNEKEHIIKPIELNEEEKILCSTSKNLLNTSNLTLNDTIEQKKVEIEIFKDTDSINLLNETNKNNQLTPNLTELSALSKSLSSFPKLNPNDRSLKTSMHSLLDVPKNMAKKSSLEHENISSSRKQGLNEIMSKNKKKKGVKLKYLIDDSCLLDTLHQQTCEKVACNNERCMGSILLSSKFQQKIIENDKDEIIKQAVDFINQFYASVKREGSKTHKERLNEIISSINLTGTYELKETELCFGARTAWRNAPRCIGRIQWSKLQVFDARYVTTARGMFEAICNHIKYVTNKGNIRSAITIFRQRTDATHDFRVWSPQFVNYAGYKIDENTVIGDRNTIEFTEICMKLGWKPKYTDFDVLPLVVQANGQDPEWFEYPPDLILEVDLVHPKFSWFKDLNLKWYCVPGVSSMMLDVGGIEFTACPFNGWYMGTEIGRDLADVNRYNKLPLIAEKMGLDIKSNFSLWKDKALIELNHAILYTFQKENITITDHHTASESFMKHYENENHLRGGCPADWVWVVPPLSSHLTPVFHLEMLNYNLKPSYEYQDVPWRKHVWKQKVTEKTNRNRRKVYFSDIARAVKFSAKLMGKALAKRVKCTILYASETGKSERFAKSLAEIFKHAFDAKTLCMKDYDVVDLEHETLLMIVTSTFGNGDPPENGEEFKKILNEMRKEKDLIKKRLNVAQDKSIYDHSGVLGNVRFSVFGLGNSSYPKFCSYAKFLDASLSELGADRISELGLGDELCGQEESFRKWSIESYKAAGEAFCIDIDNSFIESLSKDDSEWSAQTIRLTIVEANESFDLCESLSKIHGRKIVPCKLASKKNLNNENSGRVTLCIELNTQSHAGELQYKPGDHVGLLASNRKELVDGILSKITNAPPPDQRIQIELLKEKATVFGVSKQWIKDDRYPTSMTLRSALTNFLDITSPLTQKMLMYFSAQATDEKDRINLEKIARDHLAYEEWKLNSYPNLLEVLEEFPSVKPNATLLLTQLPKLQPRFYSISSSPKTTDFIDLTLGVVEYKVKGKGVHYGVCSKWLDEMEIGNIVPTFIRGAPAFRLPDDKTCPIIMVGAGTGIAPFRSFWQERKIDIEMMPKPNGINGNCWGEMFLYFGCRHPNMDDLYRTEINQMLDEKVIKYLYSAYSRETPKPKVYVQHLIEKNVESVFDAIYNKKGHFYVCGDVRMASKVTNALEFALQKQKNMTLDEAREYVFQMKEELRFHEDIFGNSLNITTE